MVISVGHARVIPRQLHKCVLFSVGHVDTQGRNFPATGNGERGEGWPFSPLRLPSGADLMATDRPYRCLRLESWLPAAETDRVPRPALTHRQRFLEPRMTVYNPFYGLRYRLFGRLLRAAGTIPRCLLPIAFHRFTILMAEVTRESDVLGTPILFAWKLERQGTVGVRIAWEGSD